MTDAIVAEGLVKRYKNVTALAGIDLRVPEGSVLALLGPNGAGKTTAVKILTTLIAADEGRPRSPESTWPRPARRTSPDRGLRPVRRRRRVPHRLREPRDGRPALPPRAPRERRAGAGAAGAASSSTTRPTGRRRPTPAACAPARPGRRPGRPSARALPRRADHGPRPAQPHRHVAHPPGAGLRRHHPPADHQYLEEADLLADKIVVIDHGRVIAEGTADALKSQVGGERLEITVSDEAHFETAVAR